MISSFNCLKNTNLLPLKLLYFNNKFANLFLILTFSLLVSKTYKKLVTVFKKNIFKEMLVNKIRIVVCALNRIKYMSHSLGRRNSI